MLYEPNTNLNMVASYVAHLKMSGKCDVALGMLRISCSVEYLTYEISRRRVITRKNKEGKRSRKWGFPDHVKKCMGLLDTHFIERFLKVRY